MTTPVPDGTRGEARERCPVCQGQWVDGRIAIPIVGSLRFVYRLGTNDVATEVAARMCQGCGHVELQAREPDLIRRAQQAAAQARPGPRWAPRTRRPAADNRPRHGQEQAE